MQPTQVNPFSPPNGAIPRVNALRNDLVADLDAIQGHLLERRFATGLGLVGVRGVGKSATLATFRRDCLSQNFLVISINVNPAQGRFIPDLSALIIDAIRTRNIAGAATQQILQGSSSIRIKGKAKIPFVPIELEFEPAAPANRASNDLTKVMSLLLKHVVSHRTPVVFLLDEGDFLHVDDYEDAFSLLLGEAAQRDLPITVLAAGSGAEVLRALHGLSTFIIDLTKALWLRRLNDAETVQLLVDTAAAGGQVWSDLDFSDAVSVCQGIPRRAQSLGRAVFSQSTERGPHIALEEAVSATQAGLDGQRHHLDRIVLNLLEELEKTVGTDAIGYGDCVELLNDVRGRTRTYDGIWQSLDSCISMGMIERDFHNDLRILTGLRSHGTHGEGRHRLHT